MAKRLRNLLIHAATRILPASKGGRVICLHEVSRGDLLDEKLVNLKKKRAVVPLDALIEDPEPAGKVSLTFDDGYASWAEIAAPVLEHHGIPATFFVNSGCVGLEREQAMGYVKNALRRTQNLLLISLEQLKALAANPLFAIGSHTINHVNLKQLDSRDQLHKEICEDRRMLEEFTGREVTFFSYPFGNMDSISEKAISVVAECGFKAAFTYVPKDYHNCHKGRDRFLIGRDGLNLYDDNDLWDAWLSGGYDWIYRIKTLLKR